jgi:protein-disulfide isomerase
MSYNHFVLSILCGKESSVKLQWKMIAILVLAIMFAFSCSKGTTKQTFVYKKPVGDGVAAKIGDITITEKELVEGIENDIYEEEKKIFDIKFNKLKSMVIEKLMNQDPKKQGLSNDEYMDKYIAGNVKVTDKQIDAFIKEKKIPSESINPQIRERIQNYLLVEEKKKMVDVWLGRQTQKNQVEVFIDRPRRPSAQVEVGNAPFVGGADAKVEIVEFSDFQCPFCARATDIINDLKKKYGNKIKVAFKQFPLPFHNQARGAAVAALCANEQGVNYFWKMHDAMFADQAKLAPEGLKATAKTIGLNTAKFNECLDSNRFADQIEKDIDQGQKVGVKSTPTFFVNGQLIAGAQPLEVFVELIEEELQK